MIVARVVGNVWATRKHPALENAKLLLVQPIEVRSGLVVGEPALAVDVRFGAGPGDTVLVVDEGGSARQILGRPSAPVRLAICGVVDSSSIGRETSRFH